MGGRISQREGGGRRETRSVRENEGRGIRRSRDRWGVTKNEKEGEGKVIKPIGISKRCGRRMVATWFEVNANFIYREDGRSGGMKEGMDIVVRELGWGCEELGCVCREEYGRL